KGGDEFSQLYWFDAGDRGITLLTDGGRSQNAGAVFSPDGRRLAWASTARNGTDRDVWILETDGGEPSGKPRLLLQEGGNWSPLDFSPDGARLLVSKYVSINESHPGVVDVASGKLELFPVEGGKAAFGDFRFAPDGKAVYFVSDEPFEGRPSEFRTLRYHDPATGTLLQLSAPDWDVTEFEIAADGRHLAYVRNEDGISRLTVLS